MAYNAVSFLLEKLGELIASRQLDAAQKEGIDDLLAGLERLKGLLEDVHIDGSFEKEIKKAVYHVEDMVDSFVAQAAAAAGQSYTARFQNLFHHNVAGSDLSDGLKSFTNGDLKSLLSQISQMELQKHTWIADDTKRENEYYSPNKVHTIENVVGLEDDLKELIARLNQESDELEVISVTGMRGIGKTTMACRIFHDPIIQFEFPLLVWVDISKKLNMRDLCLTIIKKFTLQDFSRTPVTELISLALGYLETGKFLIVLDDVRTNDAWEQIKQVLPKTNCLAKVLLTTSDDNVASSASSGVKPHKLPPLNQEESWKLLQLQVFGKVDFCPPELEKVGNLIAACCDGLPLTIILIGGVLTSKLSAEEWENISKDVSPCLTDGRQDGTTYSIISWSYSTLPPDLKDCFLYLGMFPEDMEIPVWKLIRMWIAEGFVRENSGKSLEETAKDNLNELVGRNLLMVHKININREVKTCRVHDMIRDFCIKEAGREKQDLFQEIRKSEDNGPFEPPPSELESCRRVCIHSDVMDFISMKTRISSARSFVCFSKKSLTLSPKDVSDFTDVPTLVRVFEAIPIMFPKFPLKVTQLVHLKYISLSAYELKTIPEAISKLWNLQTLLVNTSSRTLEIKADIGKLMYLRHLKTKASIVLEKGQSAASQSLQTFSYLSPRTFNEDVVSKARNLKELGIRGILSDSLQFESLICLEKLTLIHDDLTASTPKPLPCLPECGRFPPNLRFLVLSRTFLDWQHISTLGKLVTLRVLKLKHSAFMGSAWEVDGDDFCNLETLSIEHTDLAYWIASNRSFKNLKTLVLKNCENLVQIPEDLEKSLEVLYMERVTKYAVSYAKNMQQKRGGNDGFKLVIAPGDMSLS